MFELLEATDDNVVAVGVADGTRDGYRALYELLVEKTANHGSVHLYEEVPNWTVSTFLSHYRGLIPDLRYGPKFDIGRYAAVGNSIWASALYHLWKAVAPVFPVSPGAMRYYDPSERFRALEWVRTGDDGPSQ
ncbi:STAS/SEC14 domain-containing protein [Natrarchaeobius chitinivorans]|uniref:STAS/SEC14 domain-containing protein n=2 Tax=Natrarchaeobius chitinivorans TaxID=1679083 RepID=A0A3N6MD56_NATCH|nr:STAS/SEC14 domain-containing protein [Natrarchaeobius chitinivorans]